MFSESKQEKDLNAKERAMDEKRNELMAKVGQHKIYPYFLRNLVINRPNQVWSIDISYIRMGRSHMYFTGIIDWYSRYIVGWELSDTLQRLS